MSVTESLSTSLKCASKWSMSDLASSTSRVPILSCVFGWYSSAPQSFYIWAGMELSSSASLVWREPSLGRGRIRFRR